VPSFIFGLGLVGVSRVAAMFVGIAIFAAFYSWLDVFTAKKRWRMTGPTRLAMRIGSISRMVLSTVFYSVGGYFDLT